MTNNTERPSMSMGGLGEAWLPVPVRLLTAIQTAPTAKRRAWAVAYLLIWLLVFQSRQRGTTATLGDLEAWSDSKARHRTIKAKADALKLRQIWEQRTENEPKTNQKRTGGKQVQPDTSDSNEPKTNRKRTAHGRAELQLHPTNTNPPNSPPDSLSALWERLEVIRGGARRLKLTKTRRRALAARVNAHSAADVEAVWRWWQTSTHQRAVFLRDNGYGPDTLLRASKFDGYLLILSEPQEQPQGLWSALIGSLGDARSMHPPGFGWDLPIEEDQQRAACAALVTATGTQTLGQAWTSLKRCDEYKLRQLEKRFQAAVGGAQ